MQKIKFLNPSDPTIISIARMFNSEHRRISLLKKLEVAWDGNGNARSFFENEPLLVRGMSKISPDHTGDSYLAYLYAVAYAQRRIRREDKEVEQLKFLIIKNYPKTKWVKILGEFSNIASTLWSKEPEYEKHFLNYAVDKLIFISQKKKRYSEMIKTVEENTESEEDNYIDIGEIDTEVRSGENGFIANVDIADRICDLFFEAASTPWNVNEKKLS